MPNFAQIYCNTTALVMASRLSIPSWKKLESDILTFLNVVIFHASLCEGSYHPCWIQLIMRVTEIFFLLSSLRDWALKCVWEDPVWSALWWRHRRASHPYTGESWQLWQLAFILRTLEELEKTQTVELQTGTAVPVGQNSPVFRANRNIDGCTM